MERLEQEVKELQAGIVAVVQALNFLQTFLESDYGLKFQFHAYCNSPSYSHNAGVLEILKQKFDGNNLQETCYNGSDRLYQPQHESSSPVTDTSPLIHIRYPMHESIQGLEHAVMSTVSSTCTSTLNQNYITNNDPSPGNMTSHSRHASPTISSDPENLSGSQSSPIMVNEDELFGINDLATMKHEADEIYEQDAVELNAFSKQTLEDENDSCEEMVNPQDSSINEISEVKSKNVNERITPTSSKRSRATKQKATEGYKCPHCRRRFSEKVKLELHMTHHKQQFQCSECGIWLADKSVLNRHMRTHTGDRPFKCIFCKESFSRQDIVKKHIQRKHKGMLENSQNTTVKSSKSSAKNANSDNK